MNTFIRAAEVWLPSADRSLLEYGGGAYASVPYFGAVSRSLCFGRGEGLPGRAWEEGRPIVLQRFDGTYFLRVVAAHEAGPRRLLVGLVLREPGIARHGYPILAPDATPGAPGEPIGIVTSGSHSPTLGTAIAMGYVPPSLATPGTMVRIGIRSSTPTAEVVELPFHRRPRPAG